MLKLNVIKMQSADNQVCKNLHYYTDFYLFYTKEIYYLCSINFKVL